MSRLYPIYILTIAFTTFVLPYLNEGPLWKSYADTEAECCRKNWWKNILFISTLLSMKDTCIPSSWYLSTDFQLFLICLPIIHLANNHPKRKRTILISFFILSILVPSVMIYINKETSFWLFSIRDLRLHIKADHIQRMYVRFYVRSPPFVVGVCTAYITDHLIKIKYKFSVTQKILLAIIMMSVQSIFFVSYIFFRPGHLYNVWEHVVFAPFYRLVFILAGVLFIIVYMCNGFGAFSDFTSHPFPVILGRVSYHTYMINFFVAQINYFSGQSSEYYNMYNFLHRSIGDITLTTLIAFVTTLLIEGPMEELRSRIIPLKFNRKPVNEENKKRECPSC